MSPDVKSASSYQVGQYDGIVPQVYVVLLQVGV